MSRLFKTLPPKLGHALDRPRLFERLDSARTTHALIWVGSPAGSGKTTLAATYLRHTGGRALWYSVGATDAEPASFFYHFGLAAKQAGLRKAPPMFTSEYRQGLAAFTRNYFRELSARFRKPTVWVLDNFQEAGHHSALASIVVNAVDELAPGISLLILSRAPPPPPFTRLVANDCLLEFGWQDLRLDEQESATLLQQIDPRTGVHSERARELHQRSDGWAAGLVLLSKELRDPPESSTTHAMDARAAPPQGPDSTTPDHRPVGRELPDPEELTSRHRLGDIGDIEPDALQALFDYFAIEVLQGLEPSVVEFLHTCAILPSMTVPICADLAGRPDAYAVLRQLEHDKVFVTRHGRLRPVYTLHPLFRRFLIDGFHARHDPPDIRRHELRAAALLQGSDQSEAAVELLVRHAQWEEVVAVIKREAASLLKQGRHNQLLGWIRALPTTLREADAWVLCHHGAALQPTEPFSAYECFCTSYRMFREQDDPVGLYSTWVGAAETLFYRHDEMRPVRFWAAELEQIRTRHPRYPSMELRAKVGILATSMLMMAYPEHPDLPRWLKLAENTYRFLPIRDLRCILSQPLGWRYAASGDIVRLRTLALQVQPLARSSKTQHFARLQAQSCLLLDAWHAGHRTAAYASVESALKMGQSSGIGLALESILSHAAIIFLSHNDPDRAEVMIRHFADITDPQQRLALACHRWHDGWLALTRHQFMLARSNFAESQTIVEHIDTPFFEQLATGGLTQACIELGEYDDAWRWLEHTRKLLDAMCFSEHKTFHCGYLEAYWHLKQARIDAAVSALKRAFRTGRQRDNVVAHQWEHGMVSQLCALALEHHVEVDYATRLIRLYRLSPPVDSPAAKGHISHTPDNWPFDIRVHLLGRFEVLRDSQSPEPARKLTGKPRALLECLLSLGGRNVSQATLTEALWPTVDGEAGARSFHTTLHRLRKLLGHDEALILDGGHLSIDPAIVWSDVQAIEQLLETLEKRVRNSAISEFPTTQLQSLLRIFDPSIKASEPEAIWVESCLQRLERRLTSLLPDLIDQCHDSNDIDGALRTCHYLLALDPLNESVLQSLMKLCIRNKRYAEAVRTYRQCRKALAEELGVQPSENTEALHQRALQVVDLNSADAPNVTDKDYEPSG